MRCLAKKSETDWYELEIPNTLEDLQAFVGGYIETVSLFADACIVCNEEGLIRGLPYNTNICGCHFVGNILLIGIDGDEFCDVPGTLENWMEVLR